MNQSILKFVKYTTITSGIILSMWVILICVFASYSHHKAALIKAEKQEDYEVALLEHNNKEAMRGLLKNAGLEVPKQKSDVLKLTIFPQDRFLNGGKS